MKHFSKFVKLINAIFVKRCTQVSEFCISGHRNAKWSTCGTLWTTEWLRLLESNPCAQCCFEGTLTLSNDRSWIIVTLSCSSIIPTAWNWNRTIPLITNLEWQLWSNMTNTSPKNCREYFSQKRGNYVWYLYIYIYFFFKNDSLRWAKVILLKKS